jgi:elongation factor Ts
MANVTISAKDVAELRARTSAGMMDCKKALEEAGGDMTAAAEILRKKGIAKAEKRAGRSTSEGLVLISVPDNAAHGAMVELDCETDFVARTDDFRTIGRDLVTLALTGSATGTLDVDGAFLTQAYMGKTVGEFVKEASAKVGEAVTVRGVAAYKPANGVVGHYLHHNEQVGVIVEVAGATGAAAIALAKEIALHIASADPIAVAASDIPAETLDRERRIAEEQVAAEGKPEAIRAKIVDGKLKKFASDRALLEQLFIKDDSKTVGELVKAVPGASVVRFARFKVGEV